MDKEERKTFGESTSMSDSQIFYAAIDTVSLWEVATKQREYIDEDDLYIWQNIERPYLWTLLSTDGIPFDSDRWMERTNRYKDQAEEIDNSLAFNPRSPKQITEFFKTNYRIKLDSTNEEALTKLLEKNPDILEAKLILESRGLTKAAGTYGEGWLPFVDGGRVFPAWRQIGAGTGRVSVGGKVGIQNVPKLPEYRSCFRALPNHKLVIVDYASQEPRIFAHLSQDQKLIDIFRSGRDYYLSLGEEIFETSIPDKKDHRRNMMKSVALGATYGMTKKGLAKKLNITEAHAQELLDKLFMKFPGAAAYVEEANVWKPYVTTILGRKFWGNKAEYNWTNNYCNSPIQGSAADATKIAANLARKRLGFNPFVIYMHDEIVAMFPNEQLEDGKEVLATAMVEVQEKLHPDVPGGVELIVSDSWNTKE